MQHMLLLRLCPQMGPTGSQVHIQFYTRSLVPDHMPALNIALFSPYHIYSTSQIVMEERAEAPVLAHNSCKQVIQVCLAMASTVASVQLPRRVRQEVIHVDQ